MKTYSLVWGNHRLDLGKRTCVMGIVNVTPDSFSDGGLFYDTGAAIEQGLKMASQGADILDVGGESTRPFSEGVPLEEEARRVIPVIKKLAAQVSVPISVDTTKAEIAQRAIDAGASIINDISALRDDPRMATVAAQSDVPVILMHMQGTPKNMQMSPHYEDLIQEIKDFLQKSVELAIEHGIRRERLLIDPGIGFGKTLQHNLTLIRNLSEFESFDLPMVIGTSRKSFIRKILKSLDQTDLNPLSPEVEAGTQATVAVSAFLGGHIIRVHQVANTVLTLKLVDAIRNESFTF
jgi:dihydropteroate synthase